MALLQAAAAAFALPRASSPCRFEDATRASTASALAHDASACCQATLSTDRASRAVWKRSRPRARGFSCPASRLCWASRSRPEAIPPAASEIANSNALKGANCSCHDRRRARSAALWQKTAVMLAGSIPTRVGRPQKRSRPGPACEPGRRKRRRAARGRPGPSWPRRRPSDRSSSDRGPAVPGAGP